MRIVICEDVKADARCLLEYLERYLSENQLTAEIDLFESSETFLSCFEPKKYHIVFMDIFMAKDELNGMETAMQIKAQDEEVSVIFTTATAEYGIAGYQVAVYYIVKPVDYEELEKALNKCRSLLNRYAKSIAVTVNRRKKYIRLRDIHYVEAQQRSCVFVTETEKIASSRLLEGLEDDLGGSPFLRCHRSYIVNMYHVETLKNRDFILKSGFTIPISKHSLSKVRKAFHHFLCSELREIGSGF